MASSQTSVLRTGTKTRKIKMNVQPGVKVSTCIQKQVWMQLTWQWTSAGGLLSHVRGGKRGKDRRECWKSEKQEKWQAGSSLMAAASEMYRRCSFLLAPSPMKFFLSHFLAFQEFSNRTPPLLPYLVKPFAKGFCFSLGILPCFLCHLYIWHLIIFKSQY